MFNDLMAALSYVPPFSPARRSFQPLWRVPLRARFHPVRGDGVGGPPAHSRFRRAILRSGLEQKNASLVNSSPMVICAPLTADFRTSQ